MSAWLAWRRKIQQGHERCPCQKSVFKKMMPNGGCMLNSLATIVFWMVTKTSAFVTHKNSTLTACPSKSSPDSPTTPVSGLRWCLDLVPNTNLNEIPWPWRVRSRSVFSQPPSPGPRSKLDHWNDRYQRVHKRTLTGTDNDFNAGNRSVVDVDLESQESIATANWYSNSATESILRAHAVLRGAWTARSFSR